VSITSIGPTNDYQWTRLGRYSYGGELEAGKPYFIQQDVGTPNYLYYLEWLGVWYVGEELGANMGGLINWGDSVCPDQLEDPWSFYEWGDGTSNDWAEDPTLGVDCEADEEQTTSTQRTTGDPAPTGSSSTMPPSSSCTFGAACHGCDVTQEFNGQVYCCASQCDSGQIYVWEDETGVHCNCANF